MATFGHVTAGGLQVALQGDTAINGDPTGNNKQCSKFVLSESALVSKVSMDIQGHAGAGPSANVRAVIYADNAGVPGAKLAESATRNIPRNAGLRQAEDFTVTVALAAGTYWVGYLGGETSQALLIGYDTGGNRYFKTDAFSDGASDPFGAGTADAITLAVYVTYTPAAVGKSLAQPYGIKALVGKSLALPSVLKPLVGRSLSLVYGLKVKLGNSVLLPYGTRQLVTKSLALPAHVAQASVGRSLVLRSGIGQAAAIPGRSNSDTYTDGPTNPFGTGVPTSSDLTIFATYFTAWSPPKGLSEDQIANLPFVHAQEVLAGTVVPKSLVLAVLGWHGRRVDPRRGSVAIVQQGGALTGLVGERIKLTSGSRVVYAIVADEAVLPDDEDISLSRRAFLALAPGWTEALDVSVEVVA